MRKPAPLPSLPKIPARYGTHGARQGRNALPAFYRVFQHRLAPGLCCAVREALPVPHFVGAGAWTFAATVRDDGRLPLGFRPEPARDAAAALGYYLFHHPCEKFGTY